MSKNEIVTFRGKTSFAKIIGDPVENRFTDGLREWTMDLILDKEHVKKAKDLGIQSKVKTKPDYLDGRPYMTFKQKELKNDGSKNDPIRVVDIRGNAWDERLIGNESDVDVKFAISRGKYLGCYIRGVRVLNLIPYERQEFDKIDEDDPFFKNLQEEANTGPDIAFENQDLDLDDDPF